MPNPVIPPNTSPVTRIGFVQNAQVEYVDMLSEQQATIAQIGKGILAAQGVINGRPIANAFMPPLAVTTNNTLNLSIGGSNQGVVCSGYVCDGTQVQAFVVPTADASQTRIDLICIQPALAPSGTVIQRNALVAGVPTYPTPEPLNLTAVNYQYVEGTPGGGQPATPSGFYAFATVTVPANATTLNAGNIAYLFQTLNPQGPAGHGATTTTAGVVMPALAASAGFPVVDVTAFPDGTYCFISDGTHAFIGQVTNVVGETATVQNKQIILGSAGDTIASGAAVTFAGSQGAKGDPGAQGIPGDPGTNGENAFTTTTAGATIPAVGSGVSVSMASLDAFPDGSYCLLSDGTHAFAGVVVSHSGLSASITCTAITLGTAGDTVASGAKVVPSGALVAGSKGSSVQVAAVVVGSNSLAFGSALPGPASQSYLLYAQVFGSLHDSNKTCVLTGGGSGVAWSNSPTTGGNGAGPSFIVAIYGTAVGGETPSIAWVLNDSIGGQTGLAYILAIAQ